MMAVQKSICLVLTATFAFLRRRMMSAIENRIQSRRLCKWEATLNNEKKAQFFAPCRENNLEEYHAFCCRLIWLKLSLSNHNIFLAYLVVFLLSQDDDRGRVDDIKKV
jgi:hypothetical protein